MPRPIAASRRRPLATSTGLGPEMGRNTGVLQNPVALSSRKVTEPQRQLVRLPFSQPRAGGSNYVARTSDQAPRIFAGGLLEIVAWWPLQTEALRMELPEWTPSSHAKRETASFAFGKAVLNWISYVGWKGHQKESRCENPPC